MNEQRRTGRARTSWSGGLVAGALVLVACGGSDFSGTGTGSPEVAEQFEFSGDEACPQEGDFSADVRIPSGAACSYRGAITDSITVEGGARLVVVNSEVGGNLQSEGSAEVVVDSAIVEGNLQLDGGGSVTVVDSDVAGDIQVEANDGHVIVRDTRVDGSIQVSANTGGVEIEGNTVAGNIQCASNEPAPTGRGNTLGGNLEGQCSALAE